MEWLYLNNRGFTVLELMLVLLITTATITSIVAVYQRTTNKINVNHELKLLQYHIENIKHNSLIKNQKTTFKFIDNNLIIEDEIVEFEHLYFADEITYSYLSNGNISNFNTTLISTQYRDYKIVFHIGTGHFEIR